MYVQSVQKRPAFTIVELLVVIGVIALLIALLLPVLNGARQSAQSIKCANNMRTIIQAWLMYAGDNNGVLPACGDAETWPATDTDLVYYLASTTSADIEFEHGVIMPYISRTDPRVRQSFMICPVAIEPPSPNVSYVFSSDLKPENGPRRLVQIQYSSERIPLAEQQTPDSDGNFDPDDDDDTGCIRHFQHGSGAGLTGKGNYAYADGHVQTLTPQELHAHPLWLHLFR